jgi:hypothetical protein
LPWVVVLAEDTQIILERLVVVEVDVVELNKVALLAEEDYNQLQHLLATGMLVVQQLLVEELVPRLLVMVEAAQVVQEEMVTAL